MNNIFRDARDFFVKMGKDHWYKGLHGNQGADCTCMVLIMTNELHDSKLNLDVHFRILEDAVGKLFPSRTGGYHGVMAVYDFNDHPDTTQADVIAVYSRAARLLDDYIREQVMV